MKRVCWLLLLLLLAACGGAPPLTAQGVVEKLQSAGLDVTNIRDEPIDADAPLPRSYTSHMNFTVKSAGLGAGGKTRGGQVFVCDTKKNCDAIYAFFDMMKGIGGPYYYQSDAGTIVLQMNSSIAPDIAAKFAEVIKPL